MSRAHLMDDSMAPLRLVRDEQMLTHTGESAPTLGERLLYTAVIKLLEDVRDLKRKVHELEHRA